MLAGEDIVLFYSICTGKEIRHFNPAPHGMAAKPECLYSG